MFDLAWSEILLIGAVALIAIGPKDMPVAIRTVSAAIKKARRMASEFQSHVDEMVREADLGDVKKTISELRNFDLKGHVERAVDPDHSIRDTFASNPLEPAHPTPSEVSTLDEVAIAAGTEIGSVPLAEVTLPRSEPERPVSPAFVPPNLVPPVVEAAAPTPNAAPAFIPPNIARH
jgi:sec-independent protein translocase protein TatB